MKTTKGSVGKDKSLKEYKNLSQQLHKSVTLLDKAVKEYEKELQKYRRCYANEQ